ncbi:MAG: restriction endonuclease [Planctomycetota bacterium]|nr:restriction endonuclease [Planctomycetota bacterium]
MPLPSYQYFMLPILRLASDGQEHSVRDSASALAIQLKISQQDLDEVLPSGGQSRYYNRFTWALTYLYKSMLVEKTGRGRFRIAPRGIDVLKANPQKIDNAFLDQFDEFRSFRTKSDKTIAATSASPAATSPENATPDERLESAYQESRDAVVSELLQRVRAGSPKFFEQVVIDLLVAMGYGGSHADAAQVVGKSGDDGIDGVIKEDRLGLDMVYVQAKRWEGSVGPGEIDKFVGSLSRKKAHKGVFITSGSFTAGARNAAHEAALKIVLIDGDELAELMIDHGVGVAQFKSYIIKRVDGDYFDEA